MSGPRLGFPCSADFAFWQAKQPVPGWATPWVQPDPTAVRLGWEGTGRRPDIDACVNAHAGAPYKSEMEMAADNLCGFVKGWRRRGDDILANLKKLGERPSPQPDSSRRYGVWARRWTTRLEGRPSKHGKRP